jgi:hypothetical protein
MDSHKIPNEEKLEIQVYLETALGRKVTIESIQKVNSDRNESYKVNLSLNRTKFLTKYGFILQKYLEKLPI